MHRSITRRTLLSLLPAGVIAQTPLSRSKKGKQLPSAGEFVRFTDPTTETPVVRLTSLNSSSLLPSPSNRFVSLKDRALLFSSDRNGPLSPFQVDLRNGLVRQLAETPDLKPESICLDAKERSVYFIDGGELKHLEIAAKKSPSTIHENVTTFGLSPSGTLFVVSGGRLLQLIKDDAIEIASEVSECHPRPKATGCLFTRDKTNGEREFWYLTGEGQPRMLAGGWISEPFWSPDGESVTFLREIRRPSVTVSEIHEVSIDGLAESCVAPTSQFASFAPNFDGSVFVGASRSRAQPNVVLLLRSAKREMTICQHHSSHPARVWPVFSPDGKRVYFQSDEEGKSAIYSVNVEQLVEPLPDRSA